MVKNDIEEQRKEQVARLVDLVNYQNGAVVSRTVIDRKMGTVTLFAFDETQGLSEHTAPYDALLYLVEGEGVVSISGKAHNLMGGEMIIIPAGKPHSLRATKRFKMLLTMIRS